MDKIILFLSIGLIGWWIGNLAGPDQYAQILGADASAARNDNGNCRRWLLVHVRVRDAVTQ